MLRALSMRRHRRGYEQLGEGESEEANKLMSRGNSSPATSKKEAVLKSPKRTTPTPTPTPPSKEAKKASKVHPLFSMFETKRRKKATTRPDFSRYLEYVREGGAWDMAENRPVMYYK